MKRLLSAITARLGLWGCQKPEPPLTSTCERADAEALVDRLCAMGYLKSVPDDQQADRAISIPTGTTTA